LTAGTIENETERIEIEIEEERGDREEKDCLTSSNK
jgi:hypothetical protein